MKMRLNERPVVSSYEKGNVVISTQEEQRIKSKSATIFGRTIQNSEKNKRSGI